MVNKRPLIGISACLLGEKVRYDGQHKRADQIVKTLSPLVDWLPVCPEVEAGLGVPRPPLRLLRRGAAVRVVGVHDAKLDMTAKLTRYTEKRVRELSGISGFILKSRSPSCGLSSTRLGDSTELTDGIFAARLRQIWPDLPVTQESDLNSFALIMEFFYRVQLSS